MEAEQGEAGVGAHVERWPAAHGDVLGIHGWVTLTCSQSLGGGSRVWERVHALVTGDWCMQELTR